MSNDYYSAVYAWFDKCGIIANMRTHLRQNLVNALKNKDLSLKKDSDCPKSAKQYVYDLLLAEYLWTQDYVYALSVFASEAPLLVNFYKQLSGSPDVPETNSKKHKLQADYVWHTLETLGIKPDEPRGKFIVAEYSETSMPLLLCILKSLGSFTCNDPNIESVENEKLVRNQCTQTDSDTHIDDPESTKLVIAKKKLFHLKESFEKELKNKEMAIKEQMSLMQQQLVLVENKLREAQKITHFINTKEKVLAEEKRKHARYFFEKETELAFKQNALSRETDRLQRERESNRTFEEDLKKLQEELEKVKREFPKIEKSGKIPTKDVQIQTDQDSYTSDQQEKRLLNREKQELSSLIREQQSRIEELTLRAVRLSRQLEEARLSRSTNADIQSPVLQIVNRQTVISESSSTEDILQDAKMRLKRLEEESLRAEQYYYSCIIASP
ncbi:reticulocyte-binding protein 2 homolog a [Orussus abietinus]|uniref:reticulocyte-binding protein 2 homolog a n=1 Tax=Orussus abietinus TaxID=222816 RepID=UPI0006257C9A|nr:reticulocyte-binding protein 2 homolog a [Orussus abietinus]